MNRTLLLVSSLIFLCLATTARAANINAGSCSSSDVQSAINSASTGDTIIVPAGNCTWTSTVTISNKKLTMTGAGIGVTNITDQGSGGSALSVNGASAANFVNISGFTFIKSSDHPNGMVQIDGTLFNVAFRFHHNRILMAASGSRGITVNSVYGLIDNNIIDVTASSGSIQSLSIWGSSDSSDGGFTPWQQPLSMGTNKAVYFEANTITYNPADTGTEDAIDAYGGARLVIRHNTITNISIGFHGMDSGNRRSPVSFEIYNNTFTNNSTTKIRGATIRGGTGVIFNNSYGGTVPGGWNGITLMLYRACPPLDQSAWQTCNGTNLEIGSTNFSAQASRSCSTNGGVKFCSGNRDLVCTGDSTCSAAGAGSCTTFFDGSGLLGYPCRDQPGVGPGQVSAPIYVWNNGSAGVGTYDGGLACGVGLINYLRADRDYFLNVQAPGYTAYTYPHPLQAGGGGAPPDATPPAPPRNLSVS